MRGRVEVAEIVVEVRGHHVWGPPKTRAGRRTVPLPRSVVEALKTHLAGLEPDALVFPAPEGGPLRASLFPAPLLRQGGHESGRGRSDTARSASHRGGVVDRRGCEPDRGRAPRWSHVGRHRVDRYGHLLPKATHNVTTALEAKMAKAAQNRDRDMANVIPLTIARS